MKFIRRTILLLCLIAAPSESSSQSVTFIHRNLVSWGGSAIAGALGDVDGDLDLVVGQNDRLIFHEFDQNNGDFRAYAEISAPRGAVNYFGVSLADIDGDGDLDLFAEVEGISTTLYAGIFYEFLGGVDVFADEQMLLEGAGTSADVDRDGDLDLVFTLRDRSTLGWYENVDGLGSMGPFSTISTAVNGIKDIETGDIDGDGALDVIGASGSDDTVAWYKNVDGLGSTWTRNTITDTANGVTHAPPADLDNDGDMDIAGRIGNAPGAGQLGWLENQLITITDTEYELTNSAENQQLDVYPNPASGTVHLSFSMQRPADVTVEVYNILGKKISTVFKGYLLGGVQKMDLPTDSFLPGVLLVRVTTGYESRTTKLILAK